MAALYMMTVTLDWNGDGISCVYVCMARLHYWKCGDCLAVMTTQGEYGKVVLNVVSCSCGCRRVNYLGQVRGKVLVTTTPLPPCDGRCTNARGPVCECSCKGENHGSGIVVEVIASQTAIPALRSPQVAIAEEYRAAVARLDDMFDRVYPDCRDKHRRSVLMPHAAYDALAKYFMRRSAIVRMKTHKGRMRALTGYIDELAKKV